MDDEVQDELRRLRARAYGPGADIADDPVAVARLRELEELDRTRQHTALPSDAVVDGGAEAERTGVAASAGLDDLDPADIDQTPRPPLLRTRRRVWVAAVGVAAVVVAASALTAVGMSFTTVERTPGIAQTDALTPAPELDPAAVGYLGFDPEQSRGFEDYYGLTAFAGPTQIDSEGNRADCLLISDTADVADSGGALRSNAGVRFGGCAAGLFPATAEFIVNSTFPEQFRARYPVGTAVQFVLDGDDVGVFSDAG